MSKEYSDVSPKRVKNVGMLNNNNSFLVRKNNFRFALNTNRIGRNNNPNTMTDAINDPIMVHSTPKNARGVLMLNLISIPKAPYAETHKKS
jgi:hypothetical protein